MEFRRVSVEQAGWKIPQTDLPTVETESEVQFTSYPLPVELMQTPKTSDGSRYDRLPTHFQDPNDEVGRVWWRTEPGIEKVSVSPGKEGVLIDVSKEFLERRSRIDIEDARISELKPGIKESFDAIEGVTGLHFEQLGLGLTNIESISVQLTDEESLRQRLGSEFYNLVEQTTGVTLKITKEILTNTNRPLTPQYFEQLVSIALDIVGVDLETQSGALNIETKTRVRKEVAARLWQEGKIGTGDVNFVKSYALTPDSIPRTAIRKSTDSE